MLCDLIKICTHATIPPHSDIQLKWAFIISTLSQPFCLSFVEINDT